MAWGADGQLIFGHPLEGSIWRVTPDGETQVVTTPTETTFHSLPSLLPGDKVLLFTVRKRLFTWGDEELVAQVLATGRRTVLLRDAVDARYVPTGHLVFMRRGVLLEVPFDPKRLAVGGSPIPLLDGVSHAVCSGNIFDLSGVGQFAVASTGALAYVAGDSLSYPDRRLVSVDRAGREASLSAPPRGYGVSTRVSPDGRRFTVLINGVTERSGWVFDTERDTLTRLTREGETSVPFWTPDGRRLVFERLRGARWGLNDLFWVRADGSEGPKMLASDAGALCSWCLDGQHFATQKADDIWVGTLDGSTATLQRVTDTPYSEGHPELSPDGRWLVYSSNESGRFEVYVQPWPGPGPRQQVSVDGGGSPAWNPNGREIFFLDAPPNGPCRAMMVVDVSLDSALRLGRPRELFRWPGWCPGCGPVRCYDVAPDGQRFYKTEPLPAPEPPPVTHVHLIQNWLSELERRVPTR